MASTSIEIPLLTSGQINEVLEVDLNDLRGNHDHIIDILTSEQGSLSLFLEFAFQYLKRDMIDEFEIFLQKGRETGQARNSTREQNSLILILNTLASHHIEMAKSQTESTKHDQLIANATQLLNDAERLDRLDLYTIVGKANIMLARQQLDQALYTFRGALQQDPNFLPALIGSSCTYFQKQDFKSALSGYQTILSINPNIQPDVRISIGVCFHRLGMEKEAHAAFSKAVAINPENINALALLSILEINRAMSITATQEERDSAQIAASEFLARGYHSNDRHPIIFNQMSERLFLRNTLKKAQVFAEAALRMTNSKMSRAHSLALKARIAQAEKKYDLSYELFVQANELNPDSTLIQFGLGQLNIYKKKFEEAMIPLEKVLAKEQDSYETLMIAAAVYSQVPDSALKVTEKLDHLKKLLRSYYMEGQDAKSNPEEEDYVTDPELLIDMGCYFAKHDIKQAQKAFDRAIRILEDTPEMSVAPELLNNLGALYHLDAQQQMSQGHELSSGRPVTLSDTTLAGKTLVHAKELYDRALAASPPISQEGDPSDFLQTTVRYNLARLDETLNRTEEAAVQYRGILEAHPSYVDCLLRLGCMEQTNGNVEKAFDLFSDALAIDEENAKAWALVANIHIKIDAHRPARKAFEQILREIDRYNVYALCGIGNMCLEFARKDTLQSDIHLKRAAEFFNKSLQHDLYNIFAANGIAIAFAELGKLDTAHEILTQIQETTSTNTNVTFNLAHVLTEMGNPYAAIPLYESVKRREQSADIDVIKSLARAHYVVAKTEKLPDAMAIVADRLSEACALRPKDLSLKFNLALAKQQYAQILNDQLKEKRPLASLRNAVIGLDLSESIFNELSKHKPSSRLGYDVEQAKERANYSKGVRRTTEKKIHETEVLDSQREMRLAEIRAKRNEVMEQRKRDEEKRELDERLRQEELDRKRRELNILVQEENEKMRISIELDKARPTRRRADLDEGDNDEDDLPLGSDAEGNSQKSGKIKQKRKRKEKTKPTDEPAPVSNSPSARSSDEDEDVQVKRAKPSGIRSKLSAAVIGESDDDSN
ncbi:hypothetical protein BASA84_001432 [Batrachochytrium salamandrivorans]|nr:hypothetical protein BASA81_014588 [Batrachochytrium salamandrivorans]KAH9265782.1 hypothetical protein BASA84_001432 [Batrachochytrium salamandrivorans]